MGRRQQVLDPWSALSGTGRESKGGELGGAPEEHEEGIPEGRFVPRRRAEDLLSQCPGVPSPGGLEGDQMLKGFWEATVNAPRPLITRRHLFFCRAMQTCLAQGSPLRRTHEESYVRALPLKGNSLSHLS